MPIIAAAQMTSSAQAQMEAGPQSAPMAKHTTLKTHEKDEQLVMQASGRKLKWLLHLPLHPPFLRESPSDGWAPEEITASPSHPRHLIYRY